RITMSRDTCHVHCKFFVRSSIAKPESLIVGFPNTLADVSDPLFWFYEQRLQDFSAKFDGKIVAFEDIRDTTPSFGKFRDNSWFVFGVKISDKKIHTIECTYKESWYGLYRYLIGTGITWNGPMKKGRIVFDHSKICSNLFVKKPSLHYDNKSDFRQNLQPEFFKDSLVYSFSNYRPYPNEIVSIDIFKYWNDSDTADFYYDTKPIYHGFHGIDHLSYGFKSSFLYEYLADTTSYSHGFRFSDIRDEIITHSGYNNKKLSYREQVSINVLNKNLDSLKASILDKGSLQASFTFEPIHVESNCLTPNTHNEIAKNVSKRINISDNDMKMFLNLHGKDLEGDFSITALFGENTILSGLIDSVFCTGKRSLIPTYQVFAEMFGLKKGRCIKYSEKCKGKLQIKGNIKVKQTK
ncbi:MAG: hypothetical protein Q4F84_01535, partial [Fibrobacter sp.]|nr:hypothetical protein [Fibrobacter sp.]